MKIIADTRRQFHWAKGVTVTLLPGGGMEYPDEVDMLVKAWLDDYERRIASQFAQNVKTYARTFRGPVPGGRCAYCLHESGDLHREHVDSVARGGTDDPNNIVAACAVCNRKKGNLTLLQFVQLHGVPA